MPSKYDEGERILESSSTKLTKANEQVDRTWEHPFRPENASWHGWTAYSSKSAQKRFPCHSKIVKAHDVDFVGFWLNWPPRETR